MDSNGEIVNRVDQSGLVQFDLEDLHTPGARVLFDLKPWLFEGLILKEKDFREHVKNESWERFSGKLVAVTCSADAIIPTWAYMLVASALQPHARKIVFGDLNKLEETLFHESLSKIQPEEYRDKRVVIKGCSTATVPASAYVELTALLRPVVKSILYGEPCSTVPVYKAK